MSNDVSNNDFYVAVPVNDLSTIHNKRKFRELDMIT
jgi:hypothetical protein